MGRLGQNVRILGEQPEDRYRDRQAEHSHHQKENHAVKISEPEDLFDPVVLSGAQILAEHGGGGGGDGVGDNEHDGLELAADAEGGGVDQAVAVDAGGDVEHGDVDGGGLDRQRKSQPGQGGEGLSVREEAAEPEVKAKALLPAVEIDDRNDEGHRLGQDRGQGCTRGGHAEGSHKDQVQDHVQQGGDGDEEEGPGGISHAPQDGGNGIVPVDEEHARTADGAVGHGLREGLRRRIHQRGELPGKQNADGGDDQAQSQNEGEEIADDPGQRLPPVALADVLGDDDLPGLSEAHGDEGQKVHEVCADGHGGQTGAAHELPDNDHVHDVVEELEEIRQNEGDGKTDQLAGYAADRQIVDHGV